MPRGAIASALSAMKYDTSREARPVPPPVGRPRSDARGWHPARTRSSLLGREDRDWSTGFLLRCETHRRKLREFFPPSPLDPLLLPLRDPGTRHSGCLTETVELEVRLPPVRVAFATVLFPITLGAGADPGVLIEIDLDRHALIARDCASGDEGPHLRVSTGAPSTPTPSGRFRPARVIRSPGWIPGPLARSLGAAPRPPSSDGPLGAAKIRLRGAIALHGGAAIVELGKPTSLGCIELTDAELSLLIEWLDERGALEDWQPRPNGELHAAFRRRVEVVTYRTRPDDP
jgi:lipoprotein-anchoring transpeptidase ErfK/SrfK